MRNALHVLSLISCSSLLTPLAVTLRCDQPVATIVVCIVISS